MTFWQHAPANICSLVLGSVVHRFTHPVYLLWSTLFSSSIFQDLQLDGRKSNQRKIVTSCDRMYQTIRSFHSIHNVVDTGDVGVTCGQSWTPWSTRYDLWSQVRLRYPMLLYISEVVTSRHEPNDPAADYVAVQCRRCSGKLEPRCR